MGRWRNLFSCFSKQREEAAVAQERKASGNKRAHVVEPAERLPSSPTVNENISPNQQTKCEVKIQNYVPLSERAIAFTDNYVSDRVTLLNGTFEKRKVTIKKIPKYWKKTALNEMDFLSRIDNHENIIRLLCTVEDTSHIYIVTEQFITPLRRYFDYHSPSGDPKEILRQLSNALEYLNGQKIIYLNFSPMIKLTNFNHSKKLLAGQLTMPLNKDFKGVEGFMAPETKFQRQANLLSDNYSMGCLFYFMVSGGLTLTYAQQNQVTFDRDFDIRHRTFDSKDKALAFDLMHKLLRISPRERASVRVVKRHPYFWGAHEIFDLILEVTKALEIDQSKKLHKKLQFDKNNFIGADWKNAIGNEVADELTKKRHYDGRYLSQLVQAIRNHFVHGSESPLLDSTIGTTKEEIVNYWTEKFPKLIPRLYDVMQDYKTNM